MGSRALPASSGAPRSRWRSPCHSFLSSASTPLVRPGPQSQGGSLSEPCRSPAALPRPPCPQSLSPHPSLPPEAAQPNLNRVHPWGPEPASSHYLLSSFTVVLGACDGGRELAPQRKHIRLSSGGERDLRVGGATPPQDLFWDFPLEMVLGSRQSPPSTGSLVSASLSRARNPPLPGSVI